MSDLKMREFARRAEEVVPLPAFAELERRGHRLHRRRVTAGVATFAAAMLVAVGVTVLDHDTPRAVEPVRPPDDAGTGVHMYPGSTMTTLDAGTYEQVISGGEQTALVRFTVPLGWNAWRGPNRFNGHSPGRNNEEALLQKTWYAGVLYLNVTGMPTQTCGPLEQIDPTVPAVETAVANAPGFRVTQRPEPEATFGYPATHFTLRPTDAVGQCPDHFVLFATASNGMIMPWPNGRTDAWVLDVGGQPMVIVATQSSSTPPTVRAELAEVVHSTEIVVPGGD